QTADIAILKELEDHYPGIMENVTDKKVIESNYFQFGKNFQKHHMADAGRALKSIFSFIDSEDTNTVNHAVKAVNKLLDDYMSIYPGHVYPVIVDALYHHATESPSLIGKWLDINLKSDLGPFIYYRMLHVLVGIYNKMDAAVVSGAEAEKMSINKLSMSVSISLLFKGKLLGYDWYLGQSWRPEVKDSKIKEAAKVFLENLSGKTETESIPEMKDIMSGMQKYDTAADFLAFNDPEMNQLIFNILKGNKWFAERALVNFLIRDKLAKKAAGLDTYHTVYLQNILHFARKTGNENVLTIMKELHPNLKINKGEEVRSAFDDKGMTKVHVMASIISVMMLSLVTVPSVLAGSFLSSPTEPTDPVIAVSIAIGLVMVFLLPPALRTIYRLIRKRPLGINIPQMRKDYGFKDGTNMHTRIRAVLSVVFASSAVAATIYRVFLWNDAAMAKLFEGAGWTGKLITGVTGHDMMVPLGLASLVYVVTGIFKEFSSSNYYRAMIAAIIAGLFAFLGPNFVGLSGNSLGMDGWLIPYGLGSIMTVIAGTFLYKTPQKPVEIKKKQAKVQVWIPADIIETGNITYRKHDTGIVEVMYRNIEADEVFYSVLSEKLWNKRYEGKASEDIRIDTLFANEKSPRGLLLSAKFSIIGMQDDTFEVDVKGQQGIYQQGTNEEFSEFLLNGKIEDYLAKLEQTHSDLKNDRKLKKLFIRPKMNPDTLYEIKRDENGNYLLKRRLSDAYAYLFIISPEHIHNIVEGINTGEYTSSDLGTKKARDAKGIKGIRLVAKFHADIKDNERFKLTVESDKLDTDSKFFKMVTQSTIELMIPGARKLIKTANIDYLYSVLNNNFAEFIEEVSQKTTDTAVAEPGKDRQSGFAVVAIVFAALITMFLSTLGISYAGAEEGKDTKQLKEQKLLDHMKIFDPRARAEIISRTDRGELEFLTGTQVFMADYFKKFNEGEIEDEKVSRTVVGKLHEWGTQYKEGKDWYQIIDEDYKQWKEMIAVLSSSKDPHAVYVLAAMLDIMAKEDIEIVSLMDLLTYAMEGKAETADIYHSFILNNIDKKVPVSGVSEEEFKYLPHFNYIIDSNMNIFKENITKPDAVQKDSLAYKALRNIYRVIQIKDTKTGMYALSRIMVLLADNPEAFELLRVLVEGDTREILPVSMILIMYAGLGEEGDVQGVRKLQEFYLDGILDKYSGLYRADEKVSIFMNMMMVFQSGI
ncbi:hypothetical protein ACFLTD_04965, partial [Elusimicrobiota bacterium]